MTKPTFDMDAALQALREGKDLTGKDGILTPLIKQLTEATMPLLNFHRHQRILNSTQSLSWQRPLPRRGSQA